MYVFATHLEASHFSGAAAYSFKGSLHSAWFALFYIDYAEIRGNAWGRSKGQFCKNTVYLEKGMPYFVFVETNAVLVRKNDKS